MTILFLCTGNYYRSRYAELLFNIRAAEAGLPHRADSRGLATDRGMNNFGPMARCVVETLADRGMTLPQPLRFPMQVAVNDLSQAERVIALKEAEHRPLLSERYSGWEDRVEYWHVHDIDFASVSETLAAIEENIERLVAELAEKVS